MGEGRKRKIERLGERETERILRKKQKDSMACRERETEREKKY